MQWMLASGYLICALKPHFTKLHLPEHLASYGLGKRTQVSSTPLPSNVMMELTYLFSKSDYHEEGIVCLTLDIYSCTKTDSKKHLLEQV